MATTALPVETIRRILREATQVPVALDTSQVAVAVENAAETRALVHESMQDKLAFSLVSHTWHSIADEFLYEIIALNQYAHIRPLAKHLRRATGNGGPSRGWWVKRLQLDFGRSVGDAWKQGVSVSWAWGSHTLWGLVPACPNLAILLLNSEHRPPWDVGFTRGPRFRVPRALFQTVAKHCAGTLRRIEFHNTDHSLLVAKVFMYHCPELEVCRFPGAYQLHEFGAQDGSQDILDREGEPEPNPHLDPEDDREFRTAWKTADWPKIPPATISLPALHTMNVGILHTEDFKEWSLPALQSLSIRQGSLGFLARAGDEYPLTRLTYLEIFRTVDIWAILDHLPLLVGITIAMKLDLMGHGSGGAPFQLARPHRNLSRVSLVPYVHADVDTAAFIFSVVHLLAVKRLPSLRALEIVGSKGCLQRLPGIHYLDERLSKHGVTMTEVSKLFPS